MDSLVRTLVGAARDASSPGTRQVVCQQAAATLAGLALDPRNARLTRSLNQAAMEFAAAARRSEEAPPPTVDDFEELLEETAEAYQQVGGHAMDVIARRREIHEERKPGGPHVSITPESFNTDVPLGRYVVLKYRPTEEEKSVGIVESQTVAFWQGFKPEAQAATVDVAMTLPPSFTGTDATDVREARPYGVVEYGSDGNKTSAKFDIGLGTRFTVVGNYVSVLVGMDPVDTGSTPYTVGASIGVFAAPSVAPVTCTLYANSVPNGGSVLLKRPARATQLLYVATSAMAGSTRLDFLGANGVGFVYTVVVPVGTLAMTPIPFANDVGAVLVTNNTGIAATYRLPCQLAL